MYPIPSIKFNNSSVFGMKTVTEIMDTIVTSSISDRHVAGQDVGTHQPVGAMTVASQVFSDAVMEKVGQKDIVHLTVKQEVFETNHFQKKYEQCKNFKFVKISKISTLVHVSLD